MVDNSIWELTFYNNLNATLMFLPLMLVFGEIPHKIFVTQLLEFQFWVLMVVGGVCGISIGAITALQIKVC